MTLDMREFLEEAESEDDTTRGVLDRVLYRMDKYGLGLADQPTRKGKPYVPRIPMRGITTLSDRELADLQGDFVTMKEYIGEQVAIQRILEREYKAEADKSYRLVKLKAEGSATERDDRARVHPKVLKLQDKAMVAKGTHEMLQNRYEACHSGEKLCSRDVERRNREFDGERRRAGMGSRGRVVKKRGPGRSDVEVR